MKIGTTTGLAALALAIAACGGDSTASGESSTGGETLDLSAYEGPITGDVAAGEPVFANFCAGCHPDGGSGVGPALHARADSPAETRHLIRHGKARMPGFGADQISDEDLENLLAYLTNFGMFQ